VTSDTYSVDGTPTPPTHCTGPTIISRASSIKRTSRYESRNISGSVPHLPHSISMHHHSMKVQPPKLRFVSSVEFRDSTGETSTTPLSPDSPADDSSGETQKHRLQRSKGQSRKTFRYKRGGGRLNQTDSIVVVAPPVPSSAPPTQTQTTQATPTYASNTQSQSHSHFHMPPLDADRLLTDTDVPHSWDSVSQTSSTSGYRDNYSFQMGFLSPDGSLNFNEGALAGPSISIPRSSSQNSLLMLFEAQDEEDTLI
jgi:protein unc-80